MNSRHTLLSAVVAAAWILIVGSAPAPAAGALIFQAKAGTGVTTATGGYVTQWDDLINDAGTGLTPAISSNQDQSGSADPRPILRPARQWPFGSSPAMLQFDGSDDQMVLTNLAMPVDQSTIFVVGRATNGNVFIGRRSSPGNEGHWDLRYGSVTRWTPAVNGNMSLSQGTEYNFAVFSTREVRSTLSGAGGQAWVNDTGVSRSQGTGAAIPFFPSGNMAIGAALSGINTAHLRGQIAEVRIYDAALSDTERQAVETELYNTYIAPPSDVRAVSVNFASGRSGATFNVAGPAGVFTAGNWNNVTGAAGSRSALLNDQGTATGSSVAWFSGGTWGNGTNPADDDGKLMAGYLDPSVGTGVNNVTVSVRGLGAPFTTNGYSVIVYYDNDSGSNTPVGFRVTDTSGNVSEKWGLNPGNTDFPNLAGGPYVEAIGTNSATANLANFAVLTGFNGTGFDFAFINGGPDAIYRSSPTGFQIVSNHVEDIPEPATLILLAAGLAGLLGKARRQVRA